MFVWRAFKCKWISAENSGRVSCIQPHRKEYTHKHKHSFFLKQIQKTTLPCAEASCVHNEMPPPGCRCRSSRPSCAGRRLCLRPGGSWRWICRGTADDWTWCRPSSSAGALRWAPPPDTQNTGQGKSATSPADVSEPQATSSFLPYTVWNCTVVPSVFTITLHQSKSDIFLPFVFHLCRANHCFSQHVIPAHFLPLFPYF